MKDNEQRQTTYTIAQNILYCLRCTIKCCVSLLYLGIAMILLNVAMPVLATYLPKAVIACFTDNRSFAELSITVLTLMAGIAVLSAISEYLKKYFYFHKYKMNTFYMKCVSEKGLTTDYCNQENEWFRKLQTESFECCNGNASPLTSIYETLINLFTSILGLVVFFGILSRLNMGIILFLAATSGVGFFSNQRIVKWVDENSRERFGYQQQLDYINRSADDLRSAKDIRLYQMAVWFSEIYEQNMKGMAQWYKKYTSKLFGMAVCDSGFSLVRESAAYAYLLALVFHGQISVADFVLYFGAVNAFSTWFGSIMGQLAALSQQSQRIQYFRSYLEYPETYRRDGGFLVSEKERAKVIELRNVSYRYDGTEEYALRGVNLKIMPAEHLAVVGINGAGKTTLVKLICGLIDPTEGQVLYDGVDVREYDRTAYYKLFSAVFQQYSIMPVKISEIVAEAPLETVNAEKLHNCLEEAGLWQRITQLPQGVDSNFGKIIYDDGVEFSGGEMQKLLLARALYKSAPILLLDEPTAALDPVAESWFYEKYHQISAGKTSVFISHRLASTSFCNRILLIENGVVCEEGTHAQLIARKGKYYSLFETQADYYRKEGRQHGENADEKNAAAQTV
ncbi:MAG: ABC transporter ATP-binding protein/permease [Lachnospiraceae bacterium]|nr:ABC transporter ATP-binding protein/permease [Lachnospiraceae bacterium]